MKYYFVFALYGRSVNELGLGIELQQEIKFLGDKESG